MQTKTFYGEVVGDRAMLDPLRAFVDAELTFCGITIKPFVITHDVRKWSRPR